MLTLQLKDLRTTASAPPKVLFKHMSATASQQHTVVEDSIIEGTPYRKSKPKMKQSAKIDVEDVFKMPDPFLLE
jgi:hypothetical protein